MNKGILFWGDLCIDHNSINDKKVIGPGGAAFFGAQTMRQLDMQPTIISPRGHDYVNEWLKGVSVFPIEPTEEKTLVFENNYDGKSNRTLIAHNREFAYFFDPTTIPVQLLSSVRAVVVCPVDNNVSLQAIKDLKAKLSTVFTTCLPQGFFRGYDNQGVVVKQDWQNAEDFMPFFDVVCLSEQDGVGLDEKGVQWSKLGPIVIITRAKQGCSVFVNGNRRDFSAFHVENIIDPVGAGDVFAAAFIYSYLKDKDIQKAAVFANAAGALSLQFHATDLHISVADINTFLNTRE